MTCHNCLCRITKGEPYRKMNYWGSTVLVDRTLYIHYPHCPDGADPCAHHQQNVLCGKTEYNFKEETKYVKEPML